MKKITILILLLCLLLSGCQRPSEPSASTDPSVATDLTEPTTKTIHIRTSVTTRTGDTETRTEYILDGSDRVCRVEAYTNDQLTQSYDVQCDENGNYILWTSQTSQIRYSYDQAGRLTGYSAYAGDTLISSTEYTWEDDLLMSITQKMPAQSTEHRATMVYDPEGHLLRQDDYLGGTLLRYQIFTLGEDGRASGSTIYLADGTVSQTTTYHYEDRTITITADDGSYTQQTLDAHGNQISTVEYAADGSQISDQSCTWKAIQVDLDCPRASI